MKTSRLGEMKWTFDFGIWCFIRFNFLQLPLFLTTKLSGRSLDLIHLDQQEYTALQLNAPKIGA